MIRVCKASSKQRILITIIIPDLICMHKNIMTANDNTQRIYEERQQQKQEIYFTVIVSVRPLTDCQLRDLKASLFCVA